MEMTKTRQECARFPTFEASQRAAAGLCNREVMMRWWIHAYRWSSFFILLYTLLLMIVCGPRNVSKATLLNPLGLALGLVKA